MLIDHVLSNLRTHMDTFMQPGYYKKMKRWIKSVFGKATRGEQEDVFEEVCNDEHALLMGEGEEVEELVEGSL